MQNALTNYDKEESVIAIVEYVPCEKGIKQTDPFKRRLLGREQIYLDRVPKEFFL